MPTRPTYELSVKSPWQRKQNNTKQYQPRTEYWMLFSKGQKQTRLTSTAEADDMKRLLTMVGLEPRAVSTSLHDSFNSPAGFKLGLFGLSQMV